MILCDVCGSIGDVSKNCSTLTPNLQLSTNKRKKVVKTWKAKSLDMYPCFVAAAWSQDSSKVAVLFLNCYTIGEVVAFDARRYRAIDVAEMKPLLQLRSDDSFRCPTMFLIL
jgi:hypothetical protein